MRRLFQLLLLLAAVIALPGGCLSEPLPPRDRTASLVLSALPEPGEGQRQLAPGLQWLAGWELASKNYHFGGFSALMVGEDGRLTAFSDRARLLEFFPESHAENPARFDWLHDVEKYDRSTVDLEAVFRDSTSGDFWAAFERKNVIMRFSSREKLAAWNRPAEMRDWSRNGGAESMTRLATGEFLLISESPEGWLSDDYQALIFQGDPTAGAPATRLSIAIPDSFRPVDASRLPDGSLAILLRKFRLGLLPTFESALLFGKLARNGENWLWETTNLVKLDQPIPPENYEGLAIEPREDGEADIWLISDNNMSVFQRTYLIKLGWRPHNGSDEKTRRKPARLSNFSTSGKM